MRETPIILVDGEVFAAEHGPWCTDTRSVIPPPQCQDCARERGDE